MKHKKSKAMGLIHDRFAETVNLYQELEKKTRKYGTDDYLTGSEIHLIEIIGDTEETHSVTDLAGLSHVTKGAVSQNLKKLEKKGLTRKEEDPCNSSRSIVMLTSKGKAAYFSHKHWHETIDGGYIAYLSQLEEDKTEFLLEFLTRVKAFLEAILANEA